MPPSSVRDSNKVLEMLSEYGPQSRAINIRIGDPSVVKDVVSALLQNDILAALSELSVQVRDESLFDPDRSDNSEYIIPRQSHLSTSFIALLERLSAFRMSGVNIHWESVTFSSRLVELHIQNVTLGYDKAIISFLDALSSARGLRTLKIISIATLHNPKIVCDTSAVSLANLPKLQSLHLFDLYSNTLEPLLETIGLSTRSLTLLLSSKCFRAHRLSHGELGDEEPWDVYSIGSPERLCYFVKNVAVETLMLDGVWWMKKNALRSLLESMPALKTLKIDNSPFTRDVCIALERPCEGETGPREASFPLLESIHVTRCVFHAEVEETFKKVVVGHRLREVVLGGSLRYIASDGMPILRALETFNLVNWLEVNVRAFHLLGESHCSPEFYQNAWRLW
ncbi:hypothetical protein RSOLAG1IB_04382 [Rhizoctonia solani AG-1 IB]|uniref:Uncharacterized protein n=1 Tax=Thanatephorus cucumeris (strain AG1-IB / isolate 7/3/14) TaxID=1108050 RepID=A0A0B7FZN6_THACB|nr:hypothetical protein RSOLAG1IB_04382 [Rhizoctonia solani AG-1 IB]